jgi:long-chain acyl-CoA synthetase
MSFQPRFADLVELYEFAVRKYAERPLFGTKRASTGGWSWMTYRDFEAKTSEVRAGLAGLDVGPADRVAIIADNRPEWAIAAYATYGRRAAYVPMYESQHLEEWLYILNDCGAKVLFVPNGAVRDAILAARAGVPTLEHVIELGGEGTAGAMGFDELCARGRKAPVPLERPDPEDIAGYIYTSGTTGKPKGVLLTHRNFASNVSAVHEVFPIDDTDRSLSFLPWAHSFGQTCELHGLFSRGASMGIAESVDAVVPNLAEVRPTLLFSVPRVFHQLYDRIRSQNAEAASWRQQVFGAAMENSALRKRLGERKRTSGVAELKHRVFDRLVFQKVRDRLGGRLRYAFSGGAAISREVAEFIDNLGITVYEGYGLTETSPIATANWPGARRLGSVGKAIPGVTIRIDTEASGDPASGEIIVYGHNVMKGYHRLPEENAAVFTADGGFRTGDLGRIDDEGFVYITGRIKEQYKLENGKYVVPSLLEEKLKLSPYVSHAMLYGDNRPHNVALICANVPEVEKWAAQRGLRERGAALLARAEVQDLFTAEVAGLVTGFKAFERPLKLALLSEDFSTENGLLTPKMSLKRREAAKRYAAELERLYA